MSLAHTLDAYRCFAQQQGLRPMALASLRLEAQPLDTPEAAWAALQARQPLEGWLQFQSKTLVFAEGQLPEPEPDWGWLLDAEACDSAGRSLLIRTLSPGQLRLVIAEPQAAGAGERDYLTDEVRHWATGKVLERAKRRFLRYRRYWRQDDLDGLLPCFAAFQGFAE